jgi:hypothetical protein
MRDQITIERSELAEFGRKLVHQTLIELGIKVNDINPWISQHRAAQLIGRSRLTTAMQKGQVKFYKENPDMKLGRVKVNYKDVQKIMNNPKV